MTTGKSYIKVWIVRIVPNQEKKKRLETRCASLLALLWRSVKKKHDIIVQSTKCSYFCCQVKRCLHHVPRAGSTLISAVSSDTLHNCLGLCCWNNECACPVYKSLEDLCYGLNWLLGKKISQICLKFSLLSLKVVLNQLVSFDTLICPLGNL